MALPLAPVFYHDSFQPLLPSARQISAFINKQLSRNASLNNVLYAISLLPPRLLDASFASGLSVLSSELFHVSLLFW